MSKKSEIDMCNGPLLTKMIQFAIPIMLSGILQLLFNAADIVVLGQFAGNAALAAVGSTTSLINMLTNLFVGCSVGANVLIAEFYGSKRYDDVNDAVHTALLASVIGGVILAGIGIVFARPLLILMGSPEDVIDLATLYMRIYFVGMPAVLLYNFGSSILKAAGDAVHPLIYLTISGVINVLMNLFFVIVLHMTVEGVAIATITSQALAGGMIVRYLLMTDGPIHMEWKKLKIHGALLAKMIRIGLPAGIQGSLFALSNVTIQSAVNSFGSVAMAGNSAAANIEGFCYTSLNACNQATLNFTSQNRGAQKYDRTVKSFWDGLGIVVVIGLAFAAIGKLFGEVLLGIYTSDPQVVTYGLLRMSWILPFYWVSGMMEVVVGYLRGMGYSMMPTIVTLLGSCAFRILWVYTVFAGDRRLETLYLSYPISWVLTLCIHIVCVVITCRKYWKPAAKTE